jgi:hypothetical protein
MIVIKSNGTNQTTFVYNNGERIRLLQSIDLTIDEIDPTKCLLEIIPTDEKILQTLNDNHFDNNVLVLEVGHLLKYSKLTFKGRDLIQEFAAENKKIYRITFDTKVGQHNEEFNIRCTLAYSVLQETETEDGCKREPVYYGVECFSQI